MKKLERILALILAVTVAASGTPTALAANTQKEDLAARMAKTAAAAAQVQLAAPEEHPEPEAPEAETVPAVNRGAMLAAAPEGAVGTDSSMRFVQTNFDDDTGILTMSLYVKPAGTGTLTINEWEDEIYDGDFLHQGFFGFRVDASSVAPITVNAEKQEDGSVKITRKNPIIGVGQTVGYVSGSNVSVITEFGSSNEMRGAPAGSGTYCEQMNAFRYRESGDFQENNTGFFVSAARASSNSSTEEGGDRTRMLDCYFQFEFAQDLYVLPLTDGEYAGYVHVTDLYFQCYSGNDVAASDDALFSKSIYVPQTAKESADLVKEFYVKRNDPGKTNTLALTAAGFRQKNTVEGGNATNGKVLYSFFSDNADAKPKMTQWYQAGNGNTYTWESETKLTGTPGYQYSNMLRDFLTESFDAVISNIFDNTADDGETIDFWMPENAKWSDPRYQIPTKEKSDQNDTAGTANPAVPNLNAWIPQSSIEGVTAVGAAVKQVPLFFSLQANVTANSIKTPSQDDLAKFLSNIEWSFAFEDGKLLNDCETTDVADTGKVISMIAPVTEEDEDHHQVTKLKVVKRYIKQATITGEDGYYNGCRVQKVYEATAGDGQGAYLMTTPVGVTLDMVTSNFAHARLKDDDGELVTEMVNASGILPQLHITNDAAQAESYLWKTSTLTKTTGQVYLHAVYADDKESGAVPTNTKDMVIRLYKDSPRVTDVSIDTSKIGTVTYTEGGTEKTEVGFEVGESDPAASGIPVSATVLDQYAQPMKDVQCTVTFKPVALNVSNAFEETLTPRVEEEKTVYYIKYSSGKAVNDAVAGKYNLSVSCPGMSAIAPTQVYVYKAPNYLNYMKVDLSVNPASRRTEGDVEILTYKVPSISKGKSQSRTLKVRILELANQWRDPLPETVTNYEQYDVVDGIRDQDGEISKIAAQGHGVTITYDYEFGDNVTDLQKLSFVMGGTSPEDTQSFTNSGQFTYYSSTVDGAELNVTVTAAYGTGEKRVTKEKKYKFIFERNRPYLAKIEAGNLTLKVPTKAQETAGGASLKDAKGSFTVRPRDQYDEIWDWKKVEDSYDANSPDGYNNTDGAVYLPWKILPASGTWPTGIIGPTGARDGSISLTHEAQKGTVDVVATYGTADAPFTASAQLTIERDPPQPTDVAIPVKATVLVPGIGEGKASHVLSLDVEDQYGYPMTQGVDYTCTWKLSTNTGDAKVRLATVADDGEDGTDTGKVIVEECAENCMVTLTANFYYKDENDNKTRGKTVRFTDCIEVKRDIPYVETLTVKTTSVTMRAAGDNRYQTPVLEAQGTTQYGGGQDVTPVWTLQSVTLENNTTYTYVTGDPSCGITYAGGVYTCGCLQVNANGSVTFTSESDPQLIPKTFTVLADNGGGASNTGAVSVLHPNQVASKIEMMVNSNPVNVPGAGQTTPKALSAEVRDQYNIRRSDPITWAIKEAPGQDLTSTPPAVEIQGDQLLVRSNAQEGYVEVEASSGSLKNTAIVNIGMTPGVVTNVTILPMQTESASGTSVTLPISPVEVAPGTVDHFKTDSPVELPGVRENAGTYYLRARVWDHRGYAMGAEQVSWSLVGTYATAVTLNPTTGVLTIGYTEAARDAGSSTVTVRATSVTDSTKTMDLTIDVAKDPDPEAAYAIPSFEIVEDGNGRKDSGTGAAVIPRRDWTPTQVNWTAKVYSKYDEEITTGLHAAANLELVTKSSVEGALKFKMTGVSTGLLEITSLMRGDFVEVSAAPVTNPSGKISGSKKTVSLYRESGYPTELVLGENPSGLNDNENHIWVPYWGASTSASVNVPTGESFESYDYKARVVDAYFVKITDTSIHPLWTLNEQNDSVKFLVSGSPTTTAAGETVSLQVGSSAMPSTGNTTQLRKDITIDVATNGMTGEDFTGVQTITLEREPSVEKFLFFRGVKEATSASGQPIGELITQLPRPLAVAGSAVYQLEPVVYDQYGYEVSGPELVLDLDKTSIPEGYGAAPEYDPDAWKELEEQLAEAAPEGEEPQSPAEFLHPIRYKIYKLPSEAEGGEEGEEGEPSEGPEEITGTLIAEFDTTTGEVTLYNTCDLPSLEFTAYSETLKIKKTVRAPIHTDTRNPVRVEVVRWQNGIRGQAGPYQIRKGASENENYLEYVEAVLYDQYGDVFQGTSVVATWSLWMPDEEGTLIPYQEFTEDDPPQPKLDVDYLLSKTDGPSRDTTLQIQCSQFRENVLAFLQCDLKRRGSTASMGIKDIVEIELRSRSGGGGDSSPDLVTLFFDAGEYGKLVGPAAIQVTYGIKPSAIPGIKTLEGYGFFGWTSDGYNLVDPKQVEARSDTIYYAVYRKVEDTKFLDGYKDMTIRPTQELTRAELVKMIVEANSDYDKTVSYGSSFWDVPEGKWYTNYIGYAQASGLIQGYPDGSFRPDNWVTRAEAAKMLSQAMGLKEPENLESFPDVEEEKWYAEFISSLVDAGVVNGYPDGTYRPQEYITRAEAIKMIVAISPNALNDLTKANIVANGYCPFTDIHRNYWAYAYILRAAGVA